MAYNFKLEDQLTDLKKRLNSEKAYLTILENKEAGILAINRQQQLIQKTTTEIENIKTQLQTTNN